jgi:hypothetical protein
MEHIVIRSLTANGLPRNDASIQRQARGVLTQTRIGRPPFKLGADGRPLTIHEGDEIWLAYSGYGVTGKLRITKVVPVIDLRTDADVNAAAEQFYSLDPTYWNDVRSKVERASARDQPVYLCAFHVEPTQHFEVEDHFLLNKPRHAEWSWMTLDTDEKREQYLALRNTPIVQGPFADDGVRDYGFISPRVKLAVNMAWKGKAWGPVEAGESLHFDHFVPKALGGPGIYPENVVITASTLNLAKKHRIPSALPQVARQWDLLTQQEVENWGLFDGDKRDFERQQRLCRRVTAQIRERPEKERREFYLEVLSLGTGEDVRAKFIEAGIYRA